MDVFLFYSIVTRLAGLLGRHFGGRIQNSEDFVLAHDHVLVAIQLDVAAGILSEKDAISDFDVEWNQLPVFQALALPDGDDFAFLWLLFGGVGDNDTAPNRFLLLDPFDDNAIVEWSDFHVLTTPSSVLGWVEFRPGSFARPKRYY